MAELVAMVLDALTQLFLGLAPDRPRWLRRLVQAFWVLVLVLVIAAWIYGVVLLVRAL